MEMQINTKSVLGMLKWLFSFSGRATRKSFWLTALGIFLAQVLLGGLGALMSSIVDWLGVPFYLLVLALVIAGWANIFRRFHDLSLSGFWTIYLTPFGLTAMLIAYVMDADESVKGVIERIRNMGSPWLGWILAIFAWLFGSLFGLLLVLLSPRHRIDNQYRPIPYPAE